jgi:hypothetical protein
MVKTNLLKKKLFSNDEFEKKIKGCQFLLTFQIYDLNH